ncbi:MAG: ATP-binding protein [Patescibacteria group bacterium]|nr:ATP-binding protein [Patescibacteria group bacterium]
MQFYAITGLVNAVASTLIGIFVYFNKKESINRAFAIFSFSVAFWSYGYFLWQISDSGSGALFWSRVLMAGAIFIPPTFFHFILTLLDRNKEKIKTVIFSYLLFSIFLIFDFTNLFVKGVSPKAGFRFWPEPGIVFHIFLAFWMFYVFYSLFMLYKGYLASTDETRKIQIKYIFLGMFFGFFGGVTNYFLWYNIPILPLGNSLVVLFVVAVAYATLKLKLFNFDFKFVFTQTIMVFIWFFLIVHFLMAKIFYDRMSALFLLGIVILFGIILLKSILKEKSQMDEIIKLNNYKSEFFSIVAHQIKSPLAVVSGYLTMLLENIANADTRKAQEIIFRIEASNKNLMSLVNNLLDFNRFDEGKMIYSFEKLELNELIGEFAPDFQVLAKIKNLDLSVNFSREAIYVRGDKYNLAQVFRNLIDNAIKYTRDGTITISLKKEGDFALAEVADSGMGITKKDSAKLFQKFVRLNKESKVSGSGLGLYICKKIVEAHNGEIWARGKQGGEGSEFFIKLPLYSE